MTTTRRDRIWRHAISDDADVRRTYPIDALERIEQLIEDGEATHTGEVCVAIEPALPVRTGLAARAAARTSARGVRPAARLGHRATTTAC